MKKSPTISFAISTFNRSKNIYNLVSSILTHKGNEIEVVVLNNASTDDTKEVLNTIQDERLRVINYESNIGGILGPLTILFEAKGEYVFVCLDKDYIDSSYIQLIIDKLIFFKDYNIVFGKCACNLNEIGPDNFIQNQYDILKKFVYISEHPTGLFFRTKDLKTLKVIDDIKSKYFDFAFIQELIKAELTNFGNSLFINIPVFKIEKIEDCRKIASKTYSSNNLFFHPDFRRKELGIYIESLNKLNLNSLENRKLLITIYNKILLSSTFGYKTIMNDYSICEHYCINTKNINFHNLIYYNFSLTKKFIEEINGKKYRYIIIFNILKIQVKWFLKAIISVSKKIFRSFCRNDFR